MSPHPQSKVAAVREAFVNGTSLTMAATIAGVDRTTAIRWRDQARAAGDDWEAARAAARGAQTAALARIEACLAGLREALEPQGVPIDMLADGIGDPLVPRLATVRRDVWLAAGLGALASTGAVAAGLWWLA